MSGVSVDRRRLRSRPTLVVFDGLCTLGDVEHELSAANSTPTAERDATVQVITRPKSSLLTLYFLIALASGPGFPFVFVPLYFRYVTLRYTFGDDGISVSWGILFRRENHLTYPRIQDIHVTRNIVERWLGIGTVSVQTASGSGAAEAEIVGVEDFEMIRDFLYARMRGLTSDGDDAGSGPDEGDDDPAALLLEIRDALRAVNARLGALAPALDTSTAAAPPAAPDARTEGRDDASDGAS